MLLVLFYFYRITGECAHVLGLFYTLRNWVLLGMKDVPSDAACTSLPQQWNKPRGVKIQAEAVANIVISKPGKAKRTRMPITANMNDNRLVFLLLENLISSS